jgi:RNA polymerase sigma factor (sigma-70 family)
MGTAFAEGDGRDAQLEAIFRAQFAGLYRYIYRQVRNALVAEDLTSAVFLKALRWLQEDRRPESVKGWLYATARSEIADYWREQGRLDLLPLEAAEEVPVLAEVNDEQMRPLQERIQRLLDSLSERERAVLTLRYFQGYSATEIGQALGLSANHVRVLQLRALRRAAFLEVEERSVAVEAPELPYTEQAQRVLEIAKEEAHTLNHNWIGTEHLLLGIFVEESAATDLITQGLTAPNIRGGIMFILGGRYEGPPGPEVGFTPRTRTVLNMAGEEAKRLKEPAISPQHLFIALMREGQGIGAMMLQMSGVYLEETGETVRIVKVPDPVVEPVVEPADLQEALQQHPEARLWFTRLTNSKQKWFVDRIEQAADPAERSQRVAETIKQLERIGQSRQQQ